MTRTIVTLITSLTLAACVTDPGAEPDLEQSQAALSTPVFGGDLPGFPASQAKAIAAAYFNQTSPYASYFPFSAANTHSWAYAVEDFHYVESYTSLEVCGGYVRRSGAVTGSYCYIRIGL